MDAAGQSQPNSDRQFRRLLILATSLALAVMIASVGSIRTSGAGLQFVWHWSVLIWSLLGALCAWPFWRLVWAVQDRPSPRNKLRLVLFCALMFALGLAGFLYPLRYAAPAYRSDLIEGLIAAVLVLAAGGAMLYVLGRAFSRADSHSKE
jgi:cation transport ATPase